MKNITYTILFVLSIFIIYGCPTYEPQSELIEVHNNTKDVIYIYYSCTDSICLIPQLFLYDTLEKDNLIWKVAPSYRVPAYTTKPVIAQTNRVDIFKYCRSDSFNMFFIKEETMLKNTWKEICQNQLYYKVIRLTYNDLEEMEWVIFFTDDNIEY